MTNEEKAKEIIKGMCISGPWQEHIAEKAMLKMAEWKEQQMVDKACKAYCKQCDTKECEDYGSDTCNWLQKFRKTLKKG